MGFDIQLYSNLLIGIFSFAAFLIIYLRGKKGFIDYSISRYFAWFWLLTSAYWTINFFVVIAYWIDWPKFGFALVYTLFTLAILSTLPLIYYFASVTVIGKKIPNIFLILYSIIALVFLIFLFKEGLTMKFYEEWGIKYLLSPRALYIFSLTYVGVAYFVLIGFFKNIFGWLKHGRVRKLQLFLSQISLILYMIGSYLNAQGTIHLWKLQFFKVIIIVGIFSAFFSYLIVRPFSHERTIEI